MPDDVELYVWLNPYFGKVEHSGKQFKDMAVYKQHKTRIRAVIEIPINRATPSVPTCAICWRRN